MTDPYTDLLRSLTAERFGGHQRAEATAEKSAVHSPRPDIAHSPAVQVQPAAAGGPQRLVLRVEGDAEVLDVGRTRVFDPIRAGQLPSVTIGGSRRALVTEVHRYLARISDLDGGGTGAGGGR